MEMPRQNKPPETKMIKIHEKQRREKLRTHFGRQGCIIFMLVIVIFGIVIASTVFIIFEDNTKETSYKISIDDLDSCEDRPLNETAYCLSDWVETFYNYTVRDERDYTGSQGTLEDIKLNGGDCYDYSMIYNETLFDLGFLTKVIQIYPENGTGHTFLVAWDKNLTQYCNIDQKEITCQELGK